MVSRAAAASAEEGRDHLAQLSLPPAIRPALEALRGVTTSQVQALVAELDAPPMPRSPGAFRQALTGKTAGYSETPTRLVNTMLALAVVMARNPDVTVQQLADDVSSSEDLQVPVEDRPAFAKKVQVLLECRAIHLMAKATDLQLDRQAVFTGSRILSDIRPIFEKGKSDQSPAGAVVSHTLKIEYLRRGNHKEFFVALDQHDLDQMNETIDNAHKKAAGISALLNAAGITEFDAADNLTSDNRESGEQDAHSASA